MSGQRLDGTAPPLGVLLPRGGVGNIQPSFLVFPSGGCWAVEARSGGSYLRFVVAVQSVRPRSIPAACTSLREAVSASDAIVVGQVTQSDVSPDGWAWQAVHVQETVRTRFGGPVRDEFALLQDARQEPLLPVGHAYLLFVADDPARLVCAEQTLAEVLTGPAPTRVLSLQTPPARRLWSGQSLQEIVSQIRAVPPQKSSALYLGAPA